MLQRAVNFCKGHVRLRVESAFPERVVNLCAARQIPFWDLQWESPIAFTFVMTRSSWKKLRQSAQRLDMDVRVVQREGLPYFALRFRRRHALVVGLALCALLSFFGSFFIWDFKIEGNETVSEEEILRALDTCGVSLGTFGYSVRSDELRNHILLMVPELSYIAVNVSGCRAHVQVRERVEPPEDVDKRQPGNTVAVRDGLVTAIKPYDGQKQVLPGTMVQKGQMLIAGVVDNEQRGTRFLRGMGKVYARTWYDLRCQVSATAVEKAYTGEESTKIAICWGKKRLNFYSSSSIPSENCDKITTRTKLTLPGGIALPITIVRETYRWYEPVERERTAEEAQALAEPALRSYMLAGMEEGTVSSESCTAVAWDGGYLVQLSAECEEQIGRFVPIPTDDGADSP